MGLFNRAALAAGRARYAAAQGMRSAWYAAQMRAAKSRTTGFYRPDDPDFAPTRGKPDMARLRKAYFDLFLQDRRNVEAGLYPAPRDVSIAQLPNALKSARAFQADVEAVEECCRLEDHASIDNYVYGTNAKMMVHDVTAQLVGIVTHTIWESI